MPSFSYTALDGKGMTINGLIDQPDRASVISALTKQGVRPISIQEAKAKVSSFTTIKTSFGSNKVKPDHLALFTRQLAAMIGAGVPLLRALNALQEHAAESQTLRKILQGVIHDVEAGATLGDALAKYPNTFNDIYVNMVRAGESAGILDDVLKRLAIQQEKSMAMRKKIKGAMAYPLVLLCITVIAFFGLMIFIVPQIGKIATDLSGTSTDLPALTQVMMNVSDFLIKFWWIVVGGVGLIVYALTLYIKTPKGRYNYHYILLKTPIIKKIITKIVIARFARTFSALIEAGVAVLEALAITGKAMGNAVYEKALNDAAVEVKNGKTLSGVISKNPLFPSIVSQMLLVGEETGQTDQVLVKVADFYEEEVDTAIGSLSSIIEPVMIVIMGGTVGLIAASVMLPIAGMAQEIQ